MSVLLLKKNKHHHKAILKAWKTRSKGLKHSVKRLKDKVSVLEEKIKDISRIHQDEKCLKLELEADAEKNNEILDQLKDKIECPVCMEVPRNGPVPVCPNGHFVCIKCKTAACPTCRVPMGTGMSLLAGVVIDNIKHVCRFVECEESFPCDKVEDHEKTCQHRIVSCPYDLCNEKIALSGLLNHLQLSTSRCSVNSVKVPRVIDGLNGVGISYYKENSEESLLKSEMSWAMNIFSYEGNVFAVIPKKYDNFYYFTIVMLGSKKDTLKYIVNMEVHERYTSSDKSEVSFRFRGRPRSIDENMNEVRCLGLTVSNRGMEQILRKSDNLAFSVSFSLSEFKT